MANKSVNRTPYIQRDAPPASRLQPVLGGQIFILDRHVSFVMYQQ